jgi:hypothetical protein
VTCQRGGDGCDITDNPRTGNTGNTRNTGSTGQGTSGGGSNDVSSWVQDHLSLVIGLAAGIGGALLLLIFGFLIYCCRRPKAQVVNVKPDIPPPHYQ